MLINGGENSERNILTNARLSGDGYVLAITSDNRFKSLIFQAGGMNSWKQFNYQRSVVFSSYYLQWRKYKTLCKWGVRGESQVSGEIIDPVENSSFFIGVRQDLEQHFLEEFEM